MPEASAQSVPADQSVAPPAPETDDDEGPAAKDGETSGDKAQASANPVPAPEDNSASDTKPEPVTAKEDK